MLPLRTLIIPATALLLAATPVHPLRAQSAPPAPKAAERQTRAFQVLLLVGELQGDSALDTIPANAQKALKDIQDFLPYKSYRLLDAAFLRSSFSARAMLSGPDGQNYQVSFIVSASPGDKRLLIDSFTVTDPFEPLERLVATPGVRVEPVTPRPTSQLLSTSFDMAVGETVVVGTSKLDGPSKALVVLLSALP